MRSRTLWDSAVRTHRWYSAATRLKPAPATERVDQEHTWEAALDRIQDKLGIVFKNRDLLRQAFTHSSWAGAHRTNGVQGDNERLEFLGDAVLELVISHVLFQKRQEVDEGVLTQLRSGLVNRTALAQMARTLELSGCVRLGKGEAASGGAFKESINANCVEALLGALYLDQPWDLVFSIVERLFAEPVEQSGMAEEIKDPKSLLQEVSLARYGSLPRYQVVGHRGREHTKRFQVKVLVGGRVASTGQGSSKKAAEQEAATLALKRLKR